MAKKASLAGDLEQLLDDAYELVHLVRSFVALRRYDGAIAELRHLARLAEVDGVALVVGVRSEETVSTWGPKPAGRKHGRGRAAAKRPAE